MGHGPAFAASGSSAWRVVMPNALRFGCAGLVALGTALAAGCGPPEPAPKAPVRLEVDVFADTGSAERLHVSVPATPVAEPARASVWLGQVTPGRPPAVEAPVPAAPPGEVADSFPRPPAMETDPDLKPPLLRAPSRLRVPPGARRGWVELDVRVAEDGTVSDALWAGGSSDSARVAAATDCALGMRFYPALRAGRPVAVWCRQRFDFERR